MTVGPEMIWAIGMTIFSAFLGNWLRESTKAKDELKRRVEGLERGHVEISVKLVEESKVRSIVNEVVSDLKADQKETKNDVKELLSEVHELGALLAKVNLNR
jgi:uncharacterized protein YoxC